MSKCSALVSQPAAFPDSALSALAAKMVLNFETDFAARNFFFFSGKNNIFWSRIQMSL
jgi:hypothetical protein